MKQKIRIEKILTVSIILLFFGTCIISSIPAHNTQLTPLKNTMTISNKNTKPTQPEQTLISYENAKINPVHRERITPEMFSTEMPPLEKTQNEERSDQPNAKITDIITTFSITLIWKKYTDTLIIPLSSFQWNNTTKKYRYVMNNPYDFKNDNVLIGRLTSLEVLFKINLPYEICYTYNINSEPKQDSGFTQCRVTCSPLSVPETEYQDRIMTAEGAHENVNDFDSIVVKRAMNYTGDPYDTMVTFMSSNGVFQRGFQYMSCDSDGCGMNVYMQYPTPPDYFPIPGGDINRFWIESAWEGTPGDYYSSTQRFTITPINIPPNTPSKPSGCSEGILNKSYTFSTTTTDPDSNEIYYMWDWDDDSQQTWIGPYPSGETITTSHVWMNRGTYDVKVKAKDNYGSESGWSDPLNVQIVRLGDMNNDGVVDFQDINPFILALKYPDTYEIQFNLDPDVVGDCNQDGCMNASDINAFIHLIED